MNPKCVHTEGRGRRPMISLTGMVLLIAPIAILPAGRALAQAQGAPVHQGGHPGKWTYAGKTGIGTSYEAYTGGSFGAGSATGPVSKVWFSLAEGIVTETAHGLIHDAQIRDMQFLVTGQDFFDEEKRDTRTEISYLHTDAEGRPLSLAYRVVNIDKDGKYRIEKHVFTDPDRQVLFQRAIITAHEDGITPYLLINPSMGNTSNGDVAYVSDNSLHARTVNHDRYLCVKSTAPFVKTSAGFFGESDGWQDLHEDRTMDWTYRWADGGNGNVVMMAQLPVLNHDQTATVDIAVGFGGSHHQATAEADGALADGYETVLKKYNGIGPYVGWEDFLGGLSGLAGLDPYTGDGGKQLYASALVLKALEDKTHPGALIASLSIPWGDMQPADDFATGYRAVWVRDLYQVASALLALGDRETARAAFTYMRTLQVRADTPGRHPDGAVGWFLQKTHVNGTQEWYQVQMDQTAMPVMLGWKLWKAGVLTGSEIETFYWDMLKPAVELG